MNNIKIFENQEFGAIRTMSDEQGNPLFCAKDVCDALGYNNSRDAMRKHVEIDDVAKRDTMDALGRMQPTTFINESGLYSLILSSKLESARRFKHWVTSEVLPSIRKQGGYMVARPDESDEVIMARALQIMQATIQRRDEEIATLKPKAEYTDQVLDSITCLTTTQVAKGMGMTANELNRILCQKHIQYRQSGQYLLYAPFARQGLAQNRTRTFRDLFGAVHTTSQLVWTEKGRQFIYHLLNKKIAI
ncbi:MAG: phage antirepressor KilAC domain-containing protein [Bacteroidaceae bacterium]|nr:phage antirepressor KilAC domain-containing protein [Bacteroidaceae bacterium]